MNINKKFVQISKADMHMSMTQTSPSAQFQPGGIPRTALKLGEAALSLGVSEITVRRLIDRGLLRPNRATRHILIAVSEITRFLEDGSK